MKVFKLFIKMIKANTAMLILSVAIFTIFTGVMGVQENQTVQSREKINILVKDEDDSTYSKVFGEYLANIANSKSESEYGNDLRDAIFYKEVDYIVVIPKGFSQEIVSGSASIDTTNISNGIRTIAFQQKMENYLAILHSSLLIEPNISVDELKTQTQRLATQEVKASLIAQEESNLMKPYQFSNAIYPILLTSLSVIVAVVRSVFSEKSRYRLFCAPIKTTQLLLGVVLGGVVLMSAFYVLQLGILSAFGYTVFDPVNRLYIINLYLCILTSTTLALALGIMVSGKARNVGTILANLISLSASFLTGVFIPQDLLPSYITSVSRLLPTYWSINASNLIYSSQGVFNNEILQVFMIQGLFVCAFLIICALLFRTYNRIEG